MAELGNVNEHRVLGREAIYATADRLNDRMKIKTTGETFQTMS